MIDITRDNEQSPEAGGIRSRNFPLRPLRTRADNESGNGAMSDMTIDCKLGECLKQSELFDGFDKRQLADAAEILQPKQRTYKQGDRVYKRGDTADRCWVVLSGTLTVQQLQSLRHPFCQTFYDPGSVTGIQGVAHVGSVWPVTLISDEKTELVEVDQESIDKFDKDAQIIFWQNVSRILSEKLFIA